MTMKDKTLLQLWRDGMNKHATSICNTNVETNCFRKAKAELGRSASIRLVAKRAQELKLNQTTTHGAAHEQN